MAKAKGTGKRKGPKPGAIPAMRRTPIVGAKVKLKKRPIPGPTGSPDRDACLVFGLQLLDHAGRWGWTDLSSGHIRKIATSCKGWESMSSGEVFNSSGNKPIPWDSFHPDAQKRLRDIELDDYEGLWELRLSGTARLWGLLKQGIFYIVWWDPNHEVCPSRKRHT